MKFFAHWWSVPEIMKLSPWYANINGVKTPVGEWTGHDPKDGWKPTNDSTYIGYGELVEASEPLDKFIPSLMKMIKLGKFTTAGLPDGSWEGKK